MPSQKRTIDACPHTDRIHYARGMCKSCYQAQYSDRKTIDTNYESSAKGQERKVRYESSEKARERKRKWARKNAQKKKRLDSL